MEIMSNLFIGLSSENAKNLAEKQGFISRVVCEDGQCFFVTADYREDRVNFHVENGKIIKVEKG